VPVGKTLKIVTACTVLGLAPFAGAQPEVSAAGLLAAQSAKTNGVAQNLLLTNTVRSALVAAAASYYGLAASDFVGLGASPDNYPAYYGYDKATSTYWAGASLVPKHSSQAAQVAVQDDGAYLIFERTPPGAWQAHDVGYIDTVGACAAYHVSIPAPVLAVWHWAPGTCHPPVTTTSPPSPARPSAPTTPVSGTAAGLTITKALDAQIRASFFHAYLADPKPQNAFGVPAGVPESHVEGPTIEHAGVIYGISASANSYWVVADICFDTPTGCEDMGAFQLFHRDGVDGDFTYLTYYNFPRGLCGIPQALGQIWFPGGDLPMGAKCTQLPTVAGQPVLGSKAFIPRVGVGWGTYRPDEIFNGGDPSGLVRGINWTYWGQPDAYGYGKTYIFKPKGGYYPGSVTAELRAYDLGRCTPDGPLAYQHLDVREPLSPGGKLGPWFAWDNGETLCHPYV
jgi:hypothetical protein